MDYIRSCVVTRSRSLNRLRELLPPHLFDLAIKTTMTGSDRLVVFSHAYSNMADNSVPYSKSYVDILREDVLWASDDPETVSNVVLHLCRNGSGRWISPILRKATLIFDLGDVIWDECRAQEHIRQLIASFTGIPEQVVLSQWKRCAELSVGNRLENTLKMICPDNAERVRSLISDDLLKMDDSTLRNYHQIRTDAMKVLFELGKTYHLAILANQNERSWQMISDYGIELLVPIINLSCFSRYKKPHPEFFMELEQRLPQNSHKKYMIGNRVDMDLCPAKNQGWSPILFCCPNSPVDESKLQKEMQSEMCISSLSELLKLFP